MMKDTNQYTPQFKAKIALQAIRNEDSIQHLAEKNGLKEQQVREWVAMLEEGVESLYIDDLESDIRVEQHPDGDIATKLRHSLSLLQATLDATGNGILVIDNNGRIVTYNQQFTEMWNLSEDLLEHGRDEKAIQQVMDQLVDPDQFRDRIKELYENPTATSHDTLKFKDGRVFERVSFPQKLGEKVVGRVWSFNDVTRYNKAQSKINRFGQLLKSINANVEDGILRSTPEEGLIYVNDGFVEMFGYSSAEEVLQTAPENFYADQQERWKLVDKLKRQGRIKNEEVLFRRKDGSTFWGLESTILVETDGKLYIDGVINDINKRKKVEEALKLSEEKYRTIIENIEDGYFETDLQGNFTFFNESLRKVLGYPAEELMGMNNRDYMDEENAKDVYEAFNKVYRTGKAEKGYDWEITDKQGQRRYVEASVTLRRDADGEPKGFRGIVRDITQRKKHEEQMKASLREKEVLLGEIHHRVKNNLAVISGLLFLQAEQTEDDRAKTLLQQSQSRINSMALIHEMLYDNHTFSKIEPGQYIHQLVEFISGNFSPGDKEITTRIDAGNIQLDMNTAIPCALIINELLTNAYKYAFEGRKQGTINVLFHLEDQNYILEVADDGTGMDPALYPSSSDSGSGLGLFLVEKLVKQINGRMEIETDSGTRFRVTFPAKRSR
ncbi:MAG: PAS domain S-box protein [Balneolaceae bacterium]|nr:PAS domain S-box protein [Balneolaceae bacterium]